MKLFRFVLILTLIALLFIASNNCIDNDVVPKKKKAKELARHDAILLSVGTLLLTLCFGFSFKPLSPPVIVKDINVVSDTLLTKAIYNSLPTDDFETQNLKSFALGISTFLVNNNYECRIQANGSVMRLLRNFDITPHKTMVVSAFPAGAVSMSILAIFLAKGLTVKSLFIFSGFLYVIGLLVVITSRDWIMFLIGRFTVGLGSGICSAFIPVMFSIIKRHHPKLGRIFLAIYPLFISLGILLSSLLEYFILNLNCYSWRSLHILNLAFAIIGTICMIKPTKPIGYLLKSPFKCTRRKKSTQSSSVPEISIKQLLKTGYKSILIFFLGHFFQVFSNLSAYFFYTDMIFPDINNIGVITSALFLAGTGINALFMFVQIDLKHIAYISGFGCAVASFSLAIFMSKLASPKVSLIGSQIAASSFMIFFPIGFGSGPWIMPTLIFPQEYHSLFSSLGSIINWSLGFILTSITPSIFAKLGPFSFFVFGGSCLLYGFMMLFSVPKLNDHSGFLRNRILELPCTANYLAVNQQPPVDENEEDYKSKNDGNDENNGNSFAIQNEEKNEEIVLGPNDAKKDEEEIDSKA